MAAAVSFWPPERPSVEPKVKVRFVAAARTFSSLLGRRSALKRQPSWGRQRTRAVARAAPIGSLRQEAYAPVMGPR